MFFELHNGKVVVTEQGLLNISIKRLYDADTTKNKERFNKMASYIFSVYDKRSIYINMSIEDRRLIASSDVVEEKDYWMKAEENPSFKEIVEKLNQVQFTHKERLLDGVNNKIDEYLNVFNQMTLDVKNHKDHESMTKGSQSLLELFDKLEHMVNKDAASKQVGGGVSKMFEDE